MSSSIEKAVERLQRQLTPDRASPEAVEPDSPARPLDEVALPSASKSIHELDLVALSGQGYITPDSPNNRLVDEYRLLKRPLLMNAQGKGAAQVEIGNLIMVTSALPGEGKTFTSINLAMSIALERDSTVLLVDADVLKPSLSQQLGLTGRPGLIDVLTEPDIGLADVMLSTNIPKLRILPCGRPHAQSTELLASERMQQIATELSQRYDDRIVVFDAPPLLATTQAGVLSHVMGQILVVVEAAKTPQHDVKEALGQLDHSKVIGMVLNKSRGTTKHDQYYGGYYGGYGS